jgi:hypothetical protein
MSLKLTPSYPDPQNSMEQMPSHNHLDHTAEMRKGKNTTHISTTLKVLAVRFNPVQPERV